MKKEKYMAPYKVKGLAGPSAQWDYSSLAEDFDVQNTNFAKWAGVILEQALLSKRSLMCAAGFVSNGYMATPSGSVCPVKSAIAEVDGSSTSTSCHRCYMEAYTWLFEKPKGEVLEESNKNLTVGEQVLVSTDVGSGIWYEGTYLDFYSGMFIVATKLEQDPFPKIRQFIALKKKHEEKLKKINVLKNN